MSRYIAGLVHSINIAVWIFPQCTLRNSIGGLAIDKKIAKLKSSSNVSLTK